MRQGSAPGLGMAGRWQRMEAQAEAPRRTLVCEMLSAAARLAPA